mmetsp:Transcript_100438/g.283285  ORF Transcript_100438/g.283285 Transcript_100438/m.283285 type:complete len:200 (-) Transcript_100438:408-1007(-)
MVPLLPIVVGAAPGGPQRPHLIAAATMDPNAIGRAGIAATVAIDDCGSGGVVTANPFSGRHSHTVAAPIAVGESAIVPAASMRRDVGPNMATAVIGLQAQCLDALCRGVAALPGSSWSLHGIGWPLMLLVWLMLHLLLRSCSPICLVVLPPPSALLSTMPSGPREFCAQIGNRLHILAIILCSCPPLSAEMPCLAYLLL